MVTKAVKGGFKVKKKDGTLGKRLFKTQKAAQAQSRGAGKKGRKAPARRKSVARKAPARKRSRSVAKKGNPNNNRPARIGASYMAVKRGDVMLSPVIDSIAQHKTDIGAVQADLAGRNVGAYIGASVTAAVDTAIDNKMNQAGGISQGSVTAIAPEAYLGSLAFEEMRGRGFSADSARIANARYLRAAYGYDPQGNGSWDLNHPEHKTYRTIKHVGQAIRLGRRKVRAIKKLTEPVAKALGMVGLRI